MCDVMEGYGVVWHSVVNGQIDVLCCVVLYCGQMDVVYWVAVYLKAEHVVPPQGAVLER